MGKIHYIKQITKNKFLNLFELDRESEKGKKGKYYLASRAKEIENLKLKTRDNQPDGVIIYSIYEDKIVLIRQYRYPLDGYVYEFPAGLVDKGESLSEAGVREFKEETGLDLVPLEVNEAYSKPYFMSVGMTDESCGTLFGYAKGEVSDRFQEKSEEIEIILADKEEVKRILKEEQVAIVCAYMLMNYLNAEEPFEFLTRMENKKNEKKR